MSCFLSFRLLLVDEEVRLIELKTNRLIQIDEQLIILLNI